MAKAWHPLLAFIALSAAQSSAQRRIHGAILVIDTSNNASYNQVHWLVRTPYLSIKANNDTFGVDATPAPIPRSPPPPKEMLDPP